MGKIIYHRRFPDGHLENLASPKDFSLTSPGTYTDTLLHKFNTDSSFYVYSVGHRVMKPGYHISERAFDRFFVMYVAAGCCFVNGAMVGERQGCYIYPTERHTIDAPADRVCDYYWFTVKGNETGKNIHAAGFDSLPRVFACEWIDKIIPVMRDAIYNTHDDTDMEYYLIGSYNQIVSYHRHRITSQRKPSSIKDTYVEKAIKYIRENYTREIRVSDIACELHTTVNYLDNIFREKRGITPHGYITELRMSLAKSLLLDRELSVTEIASAVGYGDYTQFSTAFRKRYGAPPSMYRKEAACRPAVEEE